MKSLHGLIGKSREERTERASKTKALKKKTYHERPTEELEKEAGIGKYKGRYAD